MVSWYILPISICVAFLAMAAAKYIQNSEVWNLYWYERCGVDNSRFWSRFEGKPEFRNKVVLDVGCGHGRLCLDMARGGATKVLGIDIDDSLISFARLHLATYYPEWRSVVSFECGDIKFLPDNTFDLVVSKDVFEHVVGLKGMLRDIRRCLKPGGRLYAGFGPLYNSPNGYHLRAHFCLPWGHLLIPRSWHLRLVNLWRKEPVQSLYEVVTLNELFFADYERIILSSGMSMVSFRVNQGNSVISKILSFFRRVPFLREYCTHNIYCVMEKQGK